jgi:hypothetical protein
MFNVEPSPASWAWFAGLFEGQGSVVLHRSSRWRCRFQLKTTDHDVADLTLQRIGGSVFGPYAYRSSDGHERKPFWLWVSDGLNPHQLSRHMWPWLGERRRQKLRAFGLEPDLGSVP